MDKHPVERLLEATVSLDQKLEQAAVEELLQFVELREQLVREIGLLELSQTERDRYAQQVKEIAGADRRIVGKMEELKLEAAGQLRQLAASRTRKAAYEAGYSPESIFFDRRK